MDVGPRGGSESFSLLSQGNKLSFFNYNDKELSVTPIKNKSGEKQSVDHVQLMDSGRKVLMLSPEKNSKIFRADTVDEMDYKFLRKDQDLPINVVIPLQKYSQLDAATNDVFNLAGLGGKDNKTIFNIQYDSRDPTFVVKKDASYQYKSGSGFSSISTSVDGYVVTGDENGVVRVYNDTSKAAKFKLDQLEGVSSDDVLFPKGDPVIGIDISVKRDWVVWTTPTFLAIVHFPETDRWDTRSNKSEKPRAMLLKINPEHMKKYGIKKPDFLPAKFDAGPSLGDDNITETYVFSYTENFRVVWNMRQVNKEYKAGSTEMYGTITPIEDGNIIDYAPDYGRGGDESVIALGDRVKHLKF